MRTAEGIDRKGVRHVAEGVSIRATARRMECDQDTVCHWLPRVGRHCCRVREYFFRDLHLTREKFVKSLKSKHDSHLPFLTSADLPQYADALLEIYGETDTPPRKGRRGRLPFRVNARWLSWATRWSSKSAKEVGSCA